MQRISSTRRASQSQEEESEQEKLLRLEEIVNG